MKLFVPRERAAGETRVAATPETVKQMVGADIDVRVESGAGVGANFSDDAYREAGAEIVAESDASAARGSADVVIKVTPPNVDEVASMREGGLFVGFVAPYQSLDVVRAFRDGGISVLAMEHVPRITRAQSMDALSSQASIAGYKAVLIAADRLDKYFPLLMTAAGTLKPARVVIMGAGVAGLQAIATAKRLGAVVEVSDIRPEVKEQIESLGGKFIELPMQESGAGEGGYAKEMSADFLDKQRQIVAQHVAQSDVVITTALIPGRPAPKLVSADMVHSMRPGSVVVDLAVSQGGNCELSKPDEEVVENGVRIVGASNLPAAMPRDASLVYARNVWAMLKPMVKEGQLAIDRDDEVVAGALLTHEKQITHEATRKAEGGES